MYMHQGDSKMVIQCKNNELPTARPFMGSTRSSADHGDSDEFGSFDRKVMIEIQWGRRRI